MKAITDKKEMWAMIDYYAYKNARGEKTIPLHYYGNYPWAPTPFAVTGNGGVALWWVRPEELALFTAVCLTQGVIIDTVNEH